MEPGSLDDVLAMQIQAALNEESDLKAAAVELTKAVEANLEAQRAARKTILELNRTRLNLGMAPYPPNLDHVVSDSGGMVETAHAQVRKSILSRPQGISRVDLKTALALTDKALDNSLFRLCRSGEIQRDENRRGYYLPTGKS